MEVLRDPTAWISAADMESLLENLLRFNPDKLDETVLAESGHGGPRYRVWGVLDSVLRMMPRPQEILQQPERFLSYFISPEPPIENLRQEPLSVSFDLPLPAEQYPLITTYLKAAFESLPVYTGLGLARCEWTGIHLKIIWPPSQDTIFASDPGHQLNPELLQSVIADHQRLLRELEEKNRDLQRKDEELLHLRLELSTSTAAVAKPEVKLQSAEQILNHMNADPSVTGHVISQNLARLHDYMVRAQQLITVLTGHSKKDPAVKEALRRLDWDHVKTQYPRAISECVEHLRKLQTRSPQPTSPPSQQETLHV